MIRADYAHRQAAIRQERSPAGISARRRPAGTMAAPRIEPLPGRHNSIRFAGTAVLVSSLNSTQPAHSLPQDCRMTFTDALEALVLGLVEGLTEFIPVSSTGHLLLLGHFIGFESNGKTFEVLIQLGAILAILSVYFSKLLVIARGLPTDPGMRRFVLGVLIGFLPAAIIGAMLHGFIKEVLFDPTIVCISLIVGGVVLLTVDRLTLKVEHRDAMHYPLPMYLKIGVCQCLAMIPGVSRSGATIVSAMLMGADKRSAAEFSFFLAMPTMA